VSEKWYSLREKQRFYGLKPKAKTHKKKEETGVKANYQAL